MNMEMPFRAMRVRRAAALIGVAVMACENSPAPLAPIEVAGRATTLTAVTPLTFTDVVGNSPNQPPAVVALNVNGDPVPGITVQFLVMDGGGTIHHSGKPADGAVTTNETGIAVMPGWRFGEKPGVNKVIASSGKLSPVIFSVVTFPSPHRVARVVAGDAEVTLPRSAVDISPSVAVFDVYGNPIEGVAVSFAVSSGGGSLSGATPVTNSLGVATAASWTLGPIGRQAVTATFPSPIRPVVITALAVEAVDPSCASVRVMSIGSTMNGELGAEGCRTSSGRSFDLHSATVPADGVYRFTSRASVFDSYLEIFDSTGARVGQNDNGSHATTDSEIEAYLAKGKYTVSVTSLSPVAAGGYAISWAAADVSGCDIPAIVPNVVVKTAVRNCPEPPWGYSSDRYRIYLRKAQTLPMRFEFFDGYMEPTLQVTNSAGTAFAEITNSDYFTDELALIFAAPADGYYFVVVAGLPVGFGYTLHLK